MDFSTAAEQAGKAVDGAGVAVMIVGGVAATALFLLQAAHGPSHVADIYRGYRQSLGRAILLGLEFLVAGDIIRTVAVAPTFRNLGILAIIVLVRTFLSFALELELTGRWPWQKRPEEVVAPPAGNGARASAPRRPG